MTAKTSAATPIALQLYSVRADCEKDDGRNLPRVLEAVADIGYAAVEFAGYYGWKAADLRRLLDDNGLTCAGAHVQIDTLLGDELHRSIELHQTLGNKFLIVPGLAEQHRDSIDAWKRTAGLFNEIAEKLAPHGMVTGYHNHTVEFAPIQGQIPWDVVFGATGPGVVMQLDIGNALHGGADCAAVLRKFPGRSQSIHIKEHGGPPEAVVGEGEVDWAGLLPVIAEIADVEWYVIEHERTAARALADVDRCLRNFRRMLADLSD